jgi:hypothetical protein
MRIDSSSKVIALGYGPGLGSGVAANVTNHSPGAGHGGKGGSTSIGGGSTYGDPQEPTNLGSGKRFNRVTRNLYSRSRADN